MVKEKKELSEEKNEQLYEIEMQYMRKTYCPTRIKAMVYEGEASVVHKKMLDFLEEFEKVAAMYSIEEQPKAVKHISNAQETVKTIPKEAKPAKELVTAKEMFNINKMDYEQSKKKLAELEKVKEIEIEELVLAQMTKLNNLITFKAALILIAKTFYNRELRDSKPIIFDEAFYEKDGRPYCPICLKEGKVKKAMVLRRSAKGFLWWGCNNHRNHTEQGFAKPMKYDYNGKPSERDWRATESDSKKYGVF